MPGLIPLIEGTIPLNEAFKRYLERKPLGDQSFCRIGTDDNFDWPGSDAPWVWDERPVTKARRLLGKRLANAEAYAHPLVRREQEAQEDLRAAFYKGDLVAIVRKYGAVTMDVLPKDGWRDGFAILLFYGDPIGDNSHWTNAEGERPVVNEAAFDAWLGTPCGGTAEQSHWQDHGRATELFD